MTGSLGRVFDAWALPKGVAPPPGPGLTFGAGTVRVRYPDTTPGWIRRVVEALGDARGRLRSRPVAEIVSAVGAVGERFLDPSDPLRLRALDLLPATSGLSGPMAAAVLDGMAADWTRDRLGTCLDVEMAGGACLDGFVDAPEHRRVRAMGPDLLVQIVSGSVPGVGATALVRSLLVKSPTLLKPGRGDVVLPVLLVEGLRWSDPELADAVAVAYWPGGSTKVEAAALEAADVVTAYGDDDSVGTLRALTPVTARFVAYHHRMSLGVVGRASLCEAHAHRVAHEVAGSVAFFDQRGCVSPQVVYVEEEGDMPPQVFAAHLGRAFADLEETLPGGELDALEASALHQARGTAELMAASETGVEVHHGGAAAWTVIYDPAPAFAPSCVGRVVRVKPVRDASDVPRLVAPFSRHLQTVAVAGLEDRTARLAEALAEAGVTRVAAFDAVPFPPPWWHHDGGGSLGALVRWVDLET